MTDDQEIENQIRMQVSRVGGLVSGEFDEASEEGIVKYAVTVHQSIQHLESLCSPIIDEKYKDNKEQSYGLTKELKRENIGKILNKSQARFRKINNMLYRKGIL